MTKEQISELVKYAKTEAKNNSIYVWGGQGEKLYNLTLDKLIKMETSMSNVQRITNLVNSYIQRGVDISKAKCFDCSGLITYKLIAMGVLKSDTTADGLYKKCSKKDISDVKKGDFVFKVDSSGKATHVGIVVDNDKTVVEAYGRDLGVISNKLRQGASNFTKAGTFNG